MFASAIINSARAAIKQAAERHRLMIAINAPRVGEKVTTNFSGQVTEHEVTERDDNYFGCSGVGLKVKPIVPKSGGDEWIDSGWFDRSSTKEK